LQCELIKFRCAAQIVSCKSARSVRFYAGKISFDEDSAVCLSGNRNVAGIGWTGERDIGRELRVVENGFGAKRQIFVGEINACCDCLRLSFKIDG